jgi:hypothetical protein
MASSDEMIGQVPPATAPAATPGAQQGPGIGANEVAGAVSEMAGKLDALLQILAQQNVPESAGARASGSVEAGIENVPGLTSTSPPVARAMVDAHSRHVRMERWLKGAGLADEEAQAPEYLPLLVAAREGAVRQAGRPVGVKESEEQDDEEIDRGVGAQAELPPGVPVWPPRVFLARERTYTKGWHKYLLKQGEAHRSESDPRIAEGDTLSVASIWMDYAELSFNISQTARDEGDVKTAYDLAEMGMAYHSAAYQGVRMRIDQITLDLISKPVAEMYTRQTRMELETVTVRPDGLRILREFNRATVTARTKHAATKAAAIPHGTIDGGSDAGISRRTAKSAAGKKKEEDDKRQRKDTKNDTQRAASSAAETSDRGNAAGGK